MSGRMPAWCSLVRANNPGPMTLEGTNSWVLDAGDGGVAVVDPGPLLDEHLLALLRSGRVELVLLTHGHPDHADSAGRLAELSTARVRAYKPEYCIRGDPLGDGERIVLGQLQVLVLHTPGHTSDSVSLLVERPSPPVVLTGDTVLGWGTAVVAYPDGRLGPYLDSLSRLRDLAGNAPVAVLPGHGPVRDDVRAVAEEYLTHRSARLEQVQLALAAGAASPSEVVLRVYADVPPELRPAAEASVRAQLDYLAGRQPG